MSSVSFIDDKKAVFSGLLVFNGGPLFFLSQDVSSFGEDLFTIGFADFGGDCGFFFSKRVVLVVSAHLRIIYELKAG